MGAFLKIGAAAITVGAGAVIGAELGAQVINGVKSAANWVHRKVSPEGT